MVDLSGSSPDSPLQHSFENSVFIAPALIILSLVGLVTYKLVRSLRQKQMKQEEKRKLKDEKKKKK